MATEPASGTPEAPHWRIVAAFPEAVSARAAMERLRDAGFASGDLELMGAAPAVRPAAGEGPDAPVLGRVFWQIVLWGIVGAVIGGVIGFALTALGVGPDGTAGRALQIAGWAMFAHIIASLWAGYVVLGTRSTRDLTWQPQRSCRVLVTVRTAAGRAGAELAAL